MTPEAQKVLIERIERKLPDLDMSGFPSTRKLAADIRSLISLALTQPEGTSTVTPNELNQASIAVSLKRIADTLEEMLIMQQAKEQNRG